MKICPHTRLVLSWLWLTLAKLQQDASSRLYRMDFYSHMWMDGWMNQAYYRLSTTHGHITDGKLVCMYWTRLVLVRPAHMWMEHMSHNMWHGKLTLVSAVESRSPWSMGFPKPSISSLAHRSTWFMSKTTTWGGALWSVSRTTFSLEMDLSYFNHTCNHCLVHT